MHCDVCFIFAAKNVVGGLVEKEVLAKVKNIILQLVSDLNAGSGKEKLSEGRKTALVEEALLTIDGMK